MSNNTASSLYFPIWRNPRSGSLWVIARDRAFLFLSSKDRTQPAVLRSPSEAAQAAGAGAGGRGRCGGGPLALLPFSSPSEFGRGSKQSCGHFPRRLKNKSSDSPEKTAHVNLVFFFCWFRLTAPPPSHTIFDRENAVTENASFCIRTGAKPRI